MRAPLLFALTACGGTDPMPVGGAPDPISVIVQYHANTELEPDIKERFPACAASVGATHIHPSWLGFDLVRLHARGPDLWSASFDDVPVGFLRIRISDRNACRTDPLGAVTATVVVVNGALLTERVNTPGEGLEPGFGFTTNEDGSVTP